MNIILHNVQVLYFRIVSLPSLSNPKPCIRMPVQHLHCGPSQEQGEANGVNAKVPGFDGRFVLSV